MPKTVELAVNYDVLETDFLTLADLALSGTQEQIFSFLQNIRENYKNGSKVRNFIDECEDLVTLYGINGINGISLNGGGDYNSPTNKSSDLKLVCINGNMV